MAISATVGHNGFSMCSFRAFQVQGANWGLTCCSDAAEEMFRILEGRWKMAILFHLFGGIDKKCRVMRFSELERAIPAISQKMLIQQLREAGARWNCVADNLSSDSAQGGIPS